MAQTIDITELLGTYIPVDRRNEMASGVPLLERTHGVALFADISGFTPLAETLAQSLGPRRGAEELLGYLNTIFDALIGAVNRYRGSVIGFAGDAITCWFDEAAMECGAPAVLRAVTCAEDMQKSMRAFAASSTPLSLKVAVASGPARRFLVGDPDLQLIDVLAGQTIDRMAAAEHCAGRGEIVLDEATVAWLGGRARILEWRLPEAPQPGETALTAHDDTAGSFAVLDSLAEALEPCPWPDLPAAALGVERVRPWVLPAVYERLQAGLGEFLTELRPAVAQFVRFTGIDFEDDPAAGEKLDAFIRRIQHILVRHEGVLLQVTVGDKGAYLYAAFGAPTAHEDDARRAVQAALDVHKAVAELGTLAPVQIGISQGMTRVGAYGASNRRTYGVQGDEVNLAARLMPKAAPGEVLVSERIRRGIGKAFACEPRPAVVAKGKSKPIPVFVVTRIAPRRAVRLQAPEYPVAMIGRAAELKQLSAKLALAAAGHGQVVGIGGDAGVGKSRLAAEAIRMAQAGDFTGYGGSCQVDGVNTPYHLWRGVWQAFFDLDMGAPAAQQSAHLEQQLVRLAPERLEALPLLGIVLDLALPDNDFTRALEPRFRKSALEALLLNCLEAAALEAGEAGGGLLLVLEDLQWLDSASSDLLEAVARLAADLPLLIVLTYRPAESGRGQGPCLDGLAHSTQMRVRELNLDEVEQMVRAKLAQLFPDWRGEVPGALITRLGTRAQGNPFYLEELLNYLRDGGVDLDDPATFDSIELPDSLHRLVLARIDRLSTREQLALKVASILGRMFLLSHLHGYYPALGERPALRADIRALARLDVAPLDARAEAAAGDDADIAYLFRHIATHEVAYETLSHAARSALHGQYARFLEQLAGDETNRYLDELAYHYGRSDDLPKKCEYLRRAGVAAAARFANVEAVDYFTRALALAPEDDREERYALLLARAQVYNLQGARDAQAGDLSELHDLAAALDDVYKRAEVALERSEYFRVTSDLPSAVIAAQSALARAGEARAAGRDGAEPARLESRAQFQWGAALLYQGEFDAARAHHEQALALARSAGLRQEEARSLHGITFDLGEQGDTAGAIRFEQEALPIYREVGDKAGESGCLDTLGYLNVALANYELGANYLEQALRLSRRIGFRLREINVLYHLGISRNLMGDYAAARNYLEQCLAAGRESGDQRGVADRLINLSRSDRGLGQAAMARKRCEEALAIYQAVGDRSGEAAAWQALGEAHADLGEWQAAGESGRHALAMLQEASAAAVALVPCQADLARIALECGDAARALEYVGEILRFRDGGGNLAGLEEPLPVYLACYRVLRAAGDARAAAIQQAGLALLHERAARISDDGLRHSFLQAVHAHRDLAGGG